MGTRRFKYSILISFLVIAFSCSMQVKDQSFRTEGAKYNFAVASNSTGFKDKIHQKLIEKYKGKANIDLMGLDKLKDVNAKNYNLILVMDTCIAGRPSSNAFTKCTNDPEQKGKVVIFVTTNTPSWKYSSSGVDAITSASRIENIGPVFAEISKRIDSVIAEK